MVLTRQQEGTLPLVWYDIAVDDALPKAPSERDVRRPVGRTVIRRSQARGSSRRSRQSSTDRPARLSQDG